MKKTLCLILALTFVTISLPAFGQDKPKSSWGAVTMVDAYQIGIGDRCPMNLRLHHASPHGCSFCLAPPGWSPYLSPLRARG